MLKNDLNIADLEKYTFSKYSNEIHGIENFPKINSLLNNSVIKYQSLYPINNIKVEKYPNKDINYNQLNITHYDKSPLKKKYNNINNINNINIISQNMNQANHNTNYNNINKINISGHKKYSFSKERKLDRKKFRTPDKYMNYNKFNFINSNSSENKFNLDCIKPKNKNIQLSNIINYNENIIDKYSKMSNKRALTPDGTFYRDKRKSRINKNIIINPIDYNRNININNINIINHNSDIYNSKTKNSNFSYKDSSLSQYTFNDSNNSNNINIYNYGNSIKDNNAYDIKNIQNITKKILDSNNNNSNENKKIEYLNYQDSYFNTRLPRGAKKPFISKINKNLIQNNIYNNKTPSPIKKTNNYLGSSIYNSKTKKYLKYSRSVSSEPDMKKANNKLKYNYFKLKYLSKDLSPDNSFSNNSKNINKKYNKVFNNINTSCGNYSNDNKSNYSSEKNYNNTQPDFTKSLYNLYNLNSSNSKNDKNNLYNKDDSIKNVNNIKSNKDLYYKYLKLDSQNYNYQSYIESYNSTSKENNNSKNNKTLKKYNFEKNLNLNNFTTKFSTNNNTYDENSNNSNSLRLKEKNNKMTNTNTIEEVHLNFVNILQNTKNMMEIQENHIKDKVIYTNIDSNVVIVEERDIE